MIALPQVVTYTKPRNLCSYIAVTLTCASLGWLLGSPGLFTALFASWINFADSATTACVALIKFICRALSSAVAATPLAAAVSTRRALAVSLAAIPV